MRSWFRLNRNKLYRRFIFDPHNIIIKSTKIDKSFKIIVSLRKRNLIKIKKKKRLRFKKKIKIVPRKIYTKKDIKMKLLSFGNRIKYKKKWYKNFWSKIKLNYFLKSNLRKVVRKKETPLQYKRRRMKLNLKHKKLRAYRRSLRKRKSNNNTSSRNIYKRGVRKRMAKYIWLHVKRSIKKKKTWWLIRITLRKTAIYYGFKSLKKFRFFNKYDDSAMKARGFSSNKLESMLSIFLLRLNIFDDIFVSNNFIKFSGLILVNFKVVYNPHWYVKMNQIVSFSNLKKMQSIFKKRIIFSKYFFVKKYTVKKKKYSCAKLLRIVRNVPLYIHYDYQIMCFSIYRLPNKKELLNSKKGGINSSWAINTRLEYN